jgi:hypothetical protein
VTVAVTVAVLDADPVGVADVVGVAVTVTVTVDVNGRLDGALGDALALGGSAACAGRAVIAQVPSATAPHAPAAATSPTAHLRRIASP